VSTIQVKSAPAARWAHYLNGISYGLLFVLLIFVLTKKFIDDRKYDLLLADGQLSRDVLGSELFENRLIGKMFPLCHFIGGEQEQLVTTDLHQSGSVVLLVVSNDSCDSCVMQEITRWSKVYENQGFSHIFLIVSGDLGADRQKKMLMNKMKSITNIPVLLDTQAGVLLGLGIEEADLPVVFFVRTSGVIELCYRADYRFQHRSEMISRAFVLGVLSNE
jgi:hypothetical protein